MTDYEYNEWEERALAQRDAFYGDDDWDEDWYDNCDYDYQYQYPNWRERLVANVRLWFHCLRMRVDKRYRDKYSELLF